MGCFKKWYHFKNRWKTWNAKIFWIFKHTYHHTHQEFLRGLDDEFYAPHSRYAEIKKSDIADIKDLEILSESQEAGLYLLASRDSKMLFVTGHPEYDRYTLSKEYLRDIQKWEKIKIPYNYFPQNDTTQTPKFIWWANAEVLYRNWGEYVYKQKLDALTNSEG